MRLAIRSGRRTHRLRVSRRRTAGPGAVRCAWLAAALFLAKPVGAEERSAPLNDAAALTRVRTYCVECHRQGKAGGEVRFDLPLDRLPEQTWQKIVQVLHHADMPPVAAQQPTAEVRRQLEAWAQGRLNEHVRRRAGDPGAVAWRRLTAIELENMIRDLTGRAMRASRHFPVENFGGEGFSNVGNVQAALSGPVLDKYLAMADEVARHARFDQAGRLAFDAPGDIQAPEVRRDQALSDIKLMARRACGELYLGPGRLVGGEADERALDGAFRKAALEWTGPARQFECLWLSRAAKDPAAALDAIAQARNCNASYLRYLAHLADTCRAGSLEESLWVEPLRRLPTPRSIDQPIPPEVAAACAGTAGAVWSCVRRTMEQSGRGGPSVVVAPRTVTVRLMTSRQERRDGKNVKTNVPARRLLLVVDRPPSEVGDTTVWCGLPTVTLRRPDRDVFVEANGRRIKTGREKGEVRTIPLRKESLVALPRGASWGEHRFSPKNAGEVEPALVVAESCRLEFDLDGLAADFDPDGGGFEAAFAVDRSGSGGLVQLRSIAVDDPSQPVVPSRWPAGDDGNAVWLVAGAAAEQALRDEWAAMFVRWLPPHPLTIAPFDGSRRSNGLPDEVQFFRDDARLQRQLLDEAGRRRMDDLWANLFLLSDEPRLRLDVFVGRQQIADLDPDAQLAALAGRLASSPELRKELNHAYGDIPQEPVARLKHYRRELARHRALWRERTLAAVADFATRAWRRTLTDAERARFETQFDVLQQTMVDDEEGVLRTLLTRTLVSPHFLFRCERVAPDGSEAPLDAWELATRLSLFLWASLPDDELRRRAADGSLLRDDVLREQSRRMLSDPKVRGMAEHFFGQWLGFAGFDRLTGGPDAEVFPEFTPEVRRSLHGEAVAFFEDLLRHDRDLRTIVAAEHSFLDATLRRYYGVETDRTDKTARAAEDEAFVRTELRSAGRGGVLGMGAIHVRYSRTRRTSPVNRGLWVVENLLGRHLPPPPANVPPIPDETGAGLSLREQLARHRENPSCASCHARIDPFGFALEGFDAAGRLRPKERLADIEYDVARDGAKLEGIEGLRTYLVDHSDELQHSLVRRMLGYALNRPVSASDLPLIEETVRESARHAYRPSILVERIVLSRQFRAHRPADEREFAAGP